MSKNILTIKEYFNRGTFVIPNYQRGYKWGVPNKQDKKCAVLNEEILFSESTLDHTHGRITDPVGVNGKGLVRAVLHRDVNCLEGKIWNQWNRSSIKKKYKLQDVLQGLINYYNMIEQGNLPIEQKYIYPSEKPEEPKELFTAAQYKKIKN